MITWAKFKEQMEQAGVKDDDKIQYIDINCDAVVSMTVSFVGLSDGTRVAQVES